jgi:hypothetical protein
MRYKGTNNKTTEMILTIHIKKRTAYINVTKITYNEGMRILDYHERHKYKIKPILVSDKVNQFIIEDKEEPDNIFCTYDYLNLKGATNERHRKFKSGSKIFDR